MATFQDNFVAILVDEEEWLVERRLWRVHFRMESMTFEIKPAIDESVVVAPDLDAQRNDTACGNLLVARIRVGWIHEITAEAIDAGFTRHEISVRTVVEVPVREVELRLLTSVHERTRPFCDFLLEDLVCGFRKGEFAVNLEPGKGVHIRRFSDRNVIRRVGREDHAAQREQSDGHENGEFLGVHFLSSLLGVCFRIWGAGRLRHYSQFTVHVSFRI